MLKAKMFALVAGVLAMVILPFASNAAAQVKLESSLNIANATAGATQYTSSTNAKVDDVLKVELYIHNTELPTSGKVAQNEVAKIVIPTTPGKVQTLKSTVTASNADSVSGSATANLSLDNAYLQYIPGTATWTRNTGSQTSVKYETSKLSDTVVTTGASLGDQQPCYNYEQYVTVQVRVMAPVVSIQKLVKIDGASNTTYATSNTANPGDTLDYAIVVKNAGNTVLHNVSVGDNLPGNVTYVKGSSVLVDSNTGAKGIALVDGITTGGVNVDDLAVGGSETIFIKAKVASDLVCGSTHTLKNVAIVRAKEITGEVYNTATTQVNVAACKTTPPVTPPTTPTTPVTPATPVTTSLPDTGAAAGLAGMGGLSAIAYAGRAYLTSKKSLLGSLRK